MPFTVSHSAAALPFFRFFKSRSALVIGTMIPDLPIFFRIGTYEVTHSLIGILTQDIPLGLAVWALWRYFLRKPTRLLCPPELRRPLFDLSPNQPSALALIVAIAFGSLTHMIWDGFTHLRAFGPELFPGLLERFAGVPLYSWMQLGCSVLGLAAMVYWIQLKWESTEESAVFSPFIRIAGLITWVILSIVIGESFVGRNIFDTHHHSSSPYAFITTSMQVGFFLWSLLCFTMHCFMNAPLPKNSTVDGSNSLILTKTRKPNNANLQLITSKNSQRRHDRQDFQTQSKAVEKI